MAKTCAGLPYSSSRPLHEEERRWLAERGKKARRRRIAFGCGTALIPAFICIPLALSMVASWAPILMLPGMFVCLWVPLRWWDARKRAQVSLQSVAADEVELFAGLPSIGALGEAGLFELQVAGFAIDEESPQLLERIPTSGEVITLNGARLDPPLWADVSEVAQPVALSNDFPPRILEDFDEDVNLPTRPLSGLEMDELRNISPAKEMVRRMGCLIALTTYVFIGIVVQSPTEEGVAFMRFLWVLRVGLCGFLAWTLWCVNAERITHRRDVQGGLVVRVEENGSLLEVLPNTKLVWTIEGEPAPWRYGIQSKPRPPA